MSAADLAARVRRLDKLSRGPRLGNQHGEQGRLVPASAQTINNQRELNREEPCYE
jgi:hypothetical protein